MGFYYSDVYLRHSSFIACCHDPNCYEIAAVDVIFAMELILKDLLNITRGAAESICESLLHLFCPPTCCCCHRMIPQRTDVLCRACWEGLQSCISGDYCPSCGRDASRYAIIDNRCAACQDDMINFDGILRAGAYHDSLRDMILQFKFYEATEYKGLLCDMLNSVLKTGSFSKEIDYFVPVPLHWLRRLDRGYNQSMLLCEGIDAHKAEINTDLVRIRNTQRQWNLSRSKRKKNVEGAFAVRKGHVFSGKTVCLVDDITTSHATLNECSATLKQAGAKNVYAAVLTVAAGRLD